MKIAITTLGCKVNQYESAEAAAQLKPLAELVEFNAVADIYLINTCAVTKEAERKSRQLINRARRRNPRAKIAVLGCYSEIAAAKLKSSGVDIVIGNQEKQNLLYILFPDASTGATHNNIKRSDRTRALVKIQDGCNQFCSYCLIPYTRSTLKSRIPSLVVEEVDLLVKSGVKEVVLTGVHLGKYGFDIEEKQLLTKLVYELLDATDIARVRFSSLEPTEITTELLSLLSSTKRLAPHLHLPLQSGDTDILKAMNRPYAIKDYLDKIEYIRALIPNIAITTDIIVGFPGETERQFTNTLNMVRKISFSKVHVFKYSDRPLTSALSMPGKVAAPVKSERSARLRRLSAGLALEYAEKQVGKTVEVLVEKADNYRQQGLSGNYLRVNFDAKISYKGRLINVNINKADGGFLYGKPL